MVLSGRAAARLLAARKETTRTVTKAQGERDRFNSLVPVKGAEPELTESQMYWETMERALTGRALTILDATIAGRTRVFLVDPERFNLGLMNSPPARTEPLPRGQSTPPRREEEP